MKNYLRICTEEEVLTNTFSPITICFVKDEDIVRFPAPNGFDTMDLSDGIWQCADGDFLIKD